MGRAVAAVVVYALLVATVFTPLYDPLLSGDDESGWTLVVLAGAHIGAGAALRRCAAFLLPLPVGAAGVVLSESPLETAAAVVGPVLGAALIAVGWGLAIATRRGGAAAIASFLVALGPAVWAAIEQIDRSGSRHAPPELEAQLPIELTLGNLCPGAETPAPTVRMLERQAEVLLREVRAHPDWLVTYTYYYSDTEDPEDKREITIEELAQEQLQDLEDFAPGDCRPDLRRRLREALG
jgi:hypothetical protein